MCGGAVRSDCNDVIFAPLSSTHKALNKETGVVDSKEKKNALDAKKQAEFPLPPENMRVWIRGDKYRGKEVIKALTDLGAINTNGCAGDGTDAIYYIDERKIVSWALIHSVLVPLVANFYKEIKLPWELKDKELVWCWNPTEDFGKMVMF